MRWIAALLVANAASAQGLSFPTNAALQVDLAEAAGSYDLPVGPFAGGAVPADTVQGPIARQAWRVDAGGVTTFQLIAPLEQQLQDEGFEIVFTCETSACGGFDFRFGIEVLPPPEMYVDLGDFRFLAARRGDEAVSVLASRSNRAGFVQVIAVGAAELTPSTGAAPAVQAARPVLNLSDFGGQLEAQGFVVLDDLAFEPGSSSLGSGPFASLGALAEYLLARPDRTVALVGHTDAVGALDGNIALSRRRATSVVDRLVNDYGVPRGQLESQGMGYLSPIASNLTEEGRDANRRVEVIVTSSQ